MKTTTTKKLKTCAILATSLCGVISSAFAGTYANITIDGNFSDWADVPVAYATPEGPSDAIQYDNVYIANDANDLYIRFTLYSASPDAFADSFENLFIDTDNNASTGYSPAVGSIGSEMLIQGGSGYQEATGVFNEGAIDGLGWSIAGASDSMDFELSISRDATYDSDSNLVFDNNTIAILLEGDDSSYDSVEFAPSSGGIVYTFAPVPEPATFTLAGLGLVFFAGRFIFGRKNSRANG